MNIVMDNLLTPIKRFSLMWGYHLNRRCSLHSMVLASLRDHFLGTHQVNEAFLTHIMN